MALGHSWRILSVPLGESIMKALHQWIGGIELVNAHPPSNFSKPIKYNMNARGHDAGRIPGELVQGRP